MNPRHFTWKFMLQMKRDEILNQCTRFRKCVQVWGGIFFFLQGLSENWSGRKCLEPTSHSIFFSLVPLKLFCLSHQVFTAKQFTISHMKGHKSTFQKKIGWLSQKSQSVELSKNIHVGTCTQKMQELLFENLKPLIMREEAFRQTEMITCR